MMQKQNIKAFLFDLDGVIFDTEPQYTLFWRSQCEKYHPEHPGLEMEIKGQTLVQIFEAHFSGRLAPEQDAIVDRLNAFESQMEFRFIPGFLPFIQEARQLGIRSSVVTSSNREKMFSVYRQHPEFRSLFDQILTAEDFAHSKPHPECYQTASARLGILPEESVVFEDSVNGLKAGMASGARVVGLSTTNHADVIQPLCHLVIPDFHAVSAGNLAVFPSYSPSRQVAI